MMREHNNLLAFGDAVFQTRLEPLLVLVIQLNVERVALLFQRAEARVQPNDRVILSNIQAEE